MQQQNVSSAKQEAATAKKDADQQRDAAVKGRALAAVVQADGLRRQLAIQVGWSAWNRVEPAPPNQPKPYASATPS